MPRRLPVVPALLLLVSGLARKQGLLVMRAESNAWQEAQLPSGPLTDPSRTPRFPTASRDDRYSEEVVGRIDPKLCGLFFDGLKVLACIPPCNPVVLPPKLP